MPLTVGGGVSSLEDIRELLKAGADKVSINTAAVKDPRLVGRSAERFGSQCTVVAIDVKRVSKKKWKVYTHGGREETSLDALAWAKKVQTLGAGEILLTSMDRDGTKQGYDIDLLRLVSQTVRVPVIASGGAGSLEHLAQGLIEGKADAVLAASIFHFREFTIKQAKTYLKKRGVPVRL